MPRQRTRWPAAAIVAVAVWALTSAPQAQSNYPPERFTAFAVNLGNVGRAGSDVVDINIERWSSQAEQGRLRKALVEEGPEALLEALRDLEPVGTIRTPDSLGYNLRYAHQTPAEDGGRRIVVATDRPISFWEAVNRPRTIDYPFTVIEIDMPAEGPGEGRLSIATRITASGGVISLERYGTVPVQLRNVRSNRP